MQPLSGGVVLTSNFTVQEGEGLPRRSLPGFFGRATGNLSYFVPVLPLALASRACLPQRFAFLVRVAGVQIASAFFPRLSHLLFPPTSLAGVTGPATPVA